MAKLKMLKPRLAEAAPRLATMRVSRNSTERLRGRAGQERRVRWLSLHPLCVMCEQVDSRVTAATDVDHCVPLWKGGADEDSNLQSLCTTHHAIKTKLEAAERGR